MTDRYDPQALTAFAARLFESVGLDEDKARATADILVEGDLMGHTTHGLALLGQYQDEAAAGRMLGTGEPDIVAEAPSGQTWDGRRLPGPWLVLRAAEWATARAAETGIAAVSIRRSCHIGCLAAYLHRFASRGHFLLIASSDPAVASVAPFGGTRRVFTPDPLAAGWPSPGGPVVIGVSMSITTNGMTNRLRNEGRQFEHEVLLDAEGRPTRDPSVFFAEPAGTLLPLGGVEAGHKGFGLALMVEALTAALGGYGRADAPAHWGACVFVLAIDPARFGGLAAFTRETGWMADAVHSNPPVPGGARPRLPGERALALRAEHLAHGVALHPSIPPVLAERARRAGLAAPAPMPAAK
jgi:LDH2 family malate/lactate/ureidoglycolate dehydrogenase